MEEWMKVLADDEEMRLDNYAEATTPDGETIGVESEGLSVWTKYSGNGKNGNFAWFFYDAGNISCKNPDEEIIGKMLAIAQLLNAKVQGDDGEIYSRSADGNITCVDIGSETKLESTPKRPWWKFWE